MAVYSRASVGGFFSSITGNQTRLLGSYVLLVAAGICELSIPGVLWQPSPPWFRTSVFVLLAAGFVGTLIRSRTLRIIGWTGIMLFSCILVWNTLFADLYIAWASMDDFPPRSHAAEYKWRGLLFVAHAALLATCFKKLEAPDVTSKRFNAILGVLLAFVGIGFVQVKVEMPPIGFIDVRYDGKSPSGVFLLLENKSSRTIYIQDTDQPIATCTNIDATESDSPYIVDGPASITRISPGERFRMNVVTALPRTFKVGHCHIRVPLLGGAWVESQQFSPE
jgi:hypothetical protein